MKWLSQDQKSKEIAFRISYVQSIGAFSSILNLQSNAGYKRSEEHLLLEQILARKHWLCEYQKAYVERESNVIEVEFNETKIE